MSRRPSSGVVVALALFAVGLIGLGRTPSAKGDELRQVREDVRGPGFDPTPVQIPSVVTGIRRPATSMDLLTMRDLKGLQISPDGASVAFVVSQAVYETNSYRTGLFVVGTEPGSKPINLGSAGPPRWNEGGE